MKKKLFNPILITLFTFMLFSCESDDNINNEVELYTGRYKIISFKSNTEVDLNNDNISSEELTNEINSFDLNDLEIKPNLISFFFPKTWISFQYPSSPEGSIEFIGYGFGTNFEYEDNLFSLKEKSYIEESYIDNVESNKNVTINCNLIVIDDNHIKTSISKEYYDFNSNNWVLLNIDVIYEKQ
ncbi:hypothetical protein [Polaribacter sp. Hel1_85]|uniref:hypothetical protein n=1 Tax=Polaribacter sp. Hel1_85 TaxID=1250005 RepID=UPI0012E02ECA|nr:hypothetical protein [Polaribacter sp. Hel1_85]